MQCLVNVLHSHFLLSIAILDTRSMFVKKKTSTLMFLMMSNCQWHWSLGSQNTQISNNLAKKGYRPIWARALPLNCAMTKKNFTTKRKKGYKPIWARALPLSCAMTKMNFTAKTKRYCIIDMKGREHPEHVLRQWSLDGFVGLAIAGGEFWTGVKSGIKVSKGALGHCINVFPWALQRNFADVLKFLRPPACHSAA